MLSCSFFLTGMLISRCKHIYTFGKIHSHTMLITELKVVGSGCKVIRSPVLATCEKQRFLLVAVFYSNYSTSSYVQVLRLTEDTRFTQTIHTQKSA